MIIEAAIFSQPPFFSFLFNNFKSIPTIYTRLKQNKSQFSGLLIKKENILNYLNSLIFFFLPLSGFSD